MQYKSNRGFSLIASILSIAIAGMGLLVVSDILNFGFKGGRTISSQADFTTVVAQIGQVLSNQLTCKTAFRNDLNNSAHFSLPNTSDLTSIVSKIGNQDIDIVKTNENVTNDLKITSIRFERQTDNTGTPIVPQVDHPNLGQTTHFVQVIIEAQRFESLGSSHLSTVNNPLKLAIVTDAIGVIVDCTEPLVNSSPPPKGLVSGGGFCQTGGSAAPLGIKFNWGTATGCDGSGNLVCAAGHTPIGSGHRADSAYVGWQYLCITDLQNSPPPKAGSITGGGFCQTGGSATPLGIKFNWGTANSCNGSGNLVCEAGHTPRGSGHRADLAYVGWQFLCLKI